MKVAVESPTEFQGAVMGLLNQRRGMIVGAQDEGPMCVVEAQVPLAEMFGFSTVLRSSTQGKASSPWSSPPTARCRPPSRRNW